ncbi:MAG: hypothetical protein KDD53_05960 [Bdellovibrionales bacterium]|nr:hypothetical protein [Bdellovibrionales bacterium]
MKSALQTLEIKRYIAIDHPDAPPALVSTTCIGGHINVIQDQDGAHILPFAKALCGEDIDVKHTITLGGSSFDPNRSYRVGFKETLPENIKVKDYLLSIGAPCESVDNLIDEFELDKYGYLTCSQLSPTATRQVFLLGLQWQNSDVIVLNIYAV